MVQEFEDLFVGAVFGLPGAYFGGGGLEAAVDVAFGVDAGSVGRDGRGWADGASGSGGGGVGAVDIGLFRWV